MFGQVPEPDDGETTITGLRFVFTILGFGIIVITLLNFLIAVISETFNRICEERELYDAKELLSFIRDFDAFLLNINFAVKWEHKRFISMVKEESEDQFETLQSVIDEKFIQMDEKINDLEDKLSMMQDSINSNSINVEKKLNILTRVLDPEGKINMQLEEEAAKLKKSPTLNREGTIL